MPQDGENESAIEHVPGLPMRSDLTRTWQTDAMLEERARDAKLVTASGPGGLESMHELGFAVLEPQGRRILIRSVLGTDASKMSAGIDVDARKATVQKVIAVGPGCSKYWDKHGVPEEKRLKPGDYVWVLSTVMDRLAMLDKTIRMNTVDCKYAAVKVVPTSKALELIAAEEAKAKALTP